MRIYYVFNIKKDKYDIYNKTPSVLFNIFENIYYYKNKFNEKSADFIELIDTFNKEKINEKIFIKMHNEMRYLKRNNEHIINNLYKDEISIMKVANTHIIINCNKNYTEFFNIISLYSNKLFVCDFINQDYFFINSEITNKYILL